MIIFFSPQSTIKVGSVSENTPSELSAREICQILREVIFGQSSVSKVDQKSLGEVYAGHFQSNVNGWDISIYIDCVRSTTAKSA
ncbi:DUF7693 family protein [Pseudomonas antarctica]|uniref:DUF7693 family protein n=1 Tax=Pseudomonas antarctica TaxID=219572 RepID=UPI003F7559C6